jgi:nucleotide-binding universal stress UspA family protein
MTEQVVVGYDGTDRGADALALGVACSRVLETGLVIAAVYPSPSAIGIGRVDAEWVADRRHAAEHVLDQARRVLADWGDAPTETFYRAVGSMSAARGLHDLAEEDGTRLVVVGLHADPSRHRLFAGGTADRLLSGVPCPVGLAPAGQRNREIRDVRRIGVAYIDTEEARAALAEGVRLAEKTGASLQLYTVVAEPADVMPILLGRDAEHAFTSTAQEIYQRALDDAIGSLARTVPATGDVRFGNPVDVLAELDDEVDVLVCGSRGYGPIRRVLLGGVSARLIGRAKMPVIIAPRGE